ncbi:unnamed protein product [Porites evermanni]|uniref:Uncharacterized protein n=1 Tax=Porites evermanni TaxID=104178 RepID=A0ABN8MAA7_9CNID|nr:unnamed protein product [Porites evermanni]
MAWMNVTTNAAMKCLRSLVITFLLFLSGFARFCVTSRPEIIIAKHLQKLNPLHLQQNNEENVNDIRIFFETQLGNIIQSGCEEVVIDALVREAAGHFLYAYLIVDSIKENVSRLTPEELGRTLTSGVSSVYQSYFERLEKELTIGEEFFLTFLSALAVAKEPLPLDFVSKMLLSDIKSPAGHRKVRKAIECISTLLPIQDGCIHFFHKSVKDWLTDGAPDMYGVQHKFYVNEDQGHLALSQLCVDELDDVKRKSVNGTDFSEAVKYALQYGVGHMLELEESARAPGRFEEIINNYVTDLDIVHAKLCVRNTLNSEDIIYVQKREAFRTLSDESQRALSTLFSLLRKYHGRLSTHPSTIFQVMVNEGGDVFAGEATKVLQNREIPYMEYLHKEAVKKESNKIQAEFRCKSKVVCFDISPTQEFMVSECTYGKIYLWSLMTRELRWKRCVEVRKCFFEDSNPRRVLANSPVLTYYRSVVFHPTEPIVLPGILSHAYSIDGDLLPLFPKSNCRFSVCSVHGDESKIITDCPGDAKCLVMWNLKNGEEIARTIRNEVVLSFAWSPDGTLLAISHFSGLVCLVDPLNCLETTLAEVATNQPLGMIKFTPDIQLLFGCSWSMEAVPLVFIDIVEYWEKLSFRLHVVKLPSGTFSFNVLNNYAYDPRNYESSSKGGFLMGDPFLFDFSTHSSSLQGFAFVLNKQSVLMANFGDRKITMLNCDKRELANMVRPVDWRFNSVAFALDGKTIYGITSYPWPAERVQLVSWDVSSGDRKAEKIVAAHNILLVPVSEGVLLKEPWEDVQLWNFELSQQVRSWPNLSKISDIMPVSDQCVACVWTDFEVSILDTSNGNIVKTISLCHKVFQSTYRSWHRKAVVCNSKYQLLSFKPSTVQLSDGENELWKKTLEHPHFFQEDSLGLPWMFSPTEEFILISCKLKPLLKTEVLVLEASSGKYLRTLCTVDSILDCAFVSKTECVIVCYPYITGSYCLPLFNVSTGDFLTVLDIDFEPSRCLASCPQKGLIAIGLRNSKCMCAVIQVKLPRDKVNREAKVSESSALGDKGCATVCRPGNEL